MADRKSNEDILEKVFYKKYYIKQIIKLVSMRLAFVERIFRFKVLNV